MYYNFSIPRELKDKVERLLARHKDLGYTSVAEFMKDAVRRRIEEIESAEKLSFRKVPE